MADSSSLRLLVVDDDADTRLNLCDILEIDGHRVDTAGSVAEALGRENWADYAAIVLDRKLPDGSAEELLPRLRQLAPHAAVLIVTGYADLQGAIAALQQGAADYILKPIDPQALRISLQRITERRRLEQERARSEAAFTTLVEAAPSMIVILRADRTIAYFSRFAEELTGYQAREVHGKDFLELLLAEPDRAAAAADLHKVFAGSPTRGYETRIISREGAERWLVWNALRLDDHEGAPAILLVGQDITHLKRIQEQALQSARLAAIGQMMAGLAHESGNALARSQACLEMLAWEVQDRPEAIDLIERIQKAQNHLQQLYEEVRDYAAPLKLAREAWEVRAVWRQAWDNLALRRQGRDTVLKEHCDGVNLVCSVDAFRLDQVFRNILDNALAAAAGSVQIDITVADTTFAGKPALRIAVRDNGPGLSREQRERIFEPFYTTKTKGTGLGMAIAKRIVEAHGGQIDAGPSKGPGAEILIYLPREAQ